MSEFLKQYDWVRKTRELLFSYCESLNHEDYIKKLDSFGGASVWDLHLHVADCYKFWLREFVLKEEGAQGPNETVQDVAAMRKVFQQVDEWVNHFINTYETSWSEPMKGKVNFQGQPFEATPLWLFTHAMTHEFHHKGQMVSMTRHLGYLPVDTDLINPALA